MFPLAGSEPTGFPRVDLSSITFPNDAASHLSERHARRLACIPINAYDDTLVVACANPAEPRLARMLRNLTGRQIELVSCCPEALWHALESIYDA